MLPFADIVRTLDRVRAALLPLSSLPHAVDRAEDVTAAIHRLSDEVARLNENIEQSRPMIESLERQFSRSAGVVGSMQGLGAVLRGLGGARSGTAGGADPDAPVDAPADPAREPTGRAEEPTGGAQEPTGPDEPLR